MIEALEKKYKTPEIAIEVIKKYYDFHCIITEQYKPGNLAGCHFFSRSAYPEYKSIPAFIIPIIADLHTGKDDTFDWIKHGLKERHFESKMEWLTEKVKDEFKYKFFTQIQIMRRLI